MKPLPILLKSILLTLGVMMTTVTDTATHAQTDLAPIRAWRDANGARILSQFAELLALPNVARDLPDVRKNAEHIRAELEKRGVDVELFELEGAPPGGAPPIVFGRLDAPGAERTLGIYVHYDGQPVDADQWSQPPWQPTLYTRAIEDGGEPRPFPVADEEIDLEWRLYARSSGDDKAPIAAILAALDALRANDVPLTANLRFFFEGEEEAGSPHLAEYFETYRERIGQIDLWLICDGPVHQNRSPQLVFGVRGYTGIDLTVYGAQRYLHSGHYGNWAPNPGMRLSQLLATMKNANDEVVIEGFYESSAPVGDAERRALAALPNYDDELREEFGLAATEAGNALLSERLLIPSLNVRGMESGAVGDEARNVIPTEATASIDIRLVKGNDPEGMLDLVEAHLARQGYHVVHGDPDLETRLAHPRLVRVDRRPGYRAARTEMDLPVVQEVIAAVRKAAGDDLVLTPTMGGSLPLYLFEEKLGQPLLIVPIANHDNNQHGPDENLRVANLWYGVELMASLFTLD